MDRSLFFWINGWPDWLAPVFLFFSEVTDWAWGQALLFALIVGLAIYRPTRAAALLSIPAMLLANEFTESFKHALQLTRPSDLAADLLEKGVRIAEIERVTGIEFWVEPLGSFGSASSHSGNTMAIAVVFLILNRKLGYAWLAASFLTGLSRIYVGVHWPYQVAFGWICGALVGLLVCGAYRAWVRIKRGRQSLREGAEPAAER